MNMENEDLLNNVKKNARFRIIELIQEYCDGSQQHFVERTGLNKGAVSQYVNGKKAPSNLAAQTIATAFDVSPAWVMGFDVPKGTELHTMFVHKEDNEDFVEMIVPGNKQKDFSDIMRLADECTHEQLWTIIELLKVFVKRNQELESEFEK